MDQANQARTDIDGLEAKKRQLAEDLRLLTIRHNATKTELMRMETRHQNLKDYETRAWKALREKDQELIRRETAISMNEGTLSELRSNLPEM